MLILFLCYSQITKDDVVAVLEQTSEGRELLEKLAEKPRMLLNKDDRKVVVNQTVAELIRKTSFYPPVELKQQLADAIVALFPGAQYNRNGVRNSTAFFNKKSSKGFIQQRLKDARDASKVPRQRAPYSKKKARQARSGPENLSSGRVGFDNIDDIKTKVYIFKHCCFKLKVHLCNKHVIFFLGSMVENSPIKYLER